MTTNTPDIEARLRNFAINTLALIPDKIDQYPKTDPQLIVDGFSRQSKLATEAADELQRRADRVEALESQQISTLAALYTHAPLEVAQICDKVIDRSGGLLGRVRDYARQASRPSQPIPEGLHK